MRATGESHTGMNGNGNGKEVRNTHTSRSWWKSTLTSEGFCVIIFLGPSRLQYLGMRLWRLVFPFERDGLS